MYDETEYQCFHINVFINLIVFDILCFYPLKDNRAVRLVAVCKPHHILIVNISISQVRPIIACSKLSRIYTVIYPIYYYCNYYNL